MRVRAALLIVPLLLALLVAPAAGFGLDPAGAPEGAPAPAASPALQSDGANETDVRQVLRVNLTAEGDARWTITTRIHGLETEEDRRSFREMADEYENGETDAGYSAETFERFAAAASDSTGREMAIVNESRSSAIRNETGYLSFSFTWTNFARVDDGKLHLGDVFQTSSGTWLSGIEDGQRLVISAPEGYAFESWNFGTSPRVQSGTATWTGPVSFAPGDIEATYVPTGGSEGPDRPLPGQSSLGTFALIGGSLMVLLGVLAVAGYAVGTRREDVAALVAALPVVGDDRPAMPAGDGGETDDAPAGRLESPDGPTATEADATDAEPPAAAPGADDEAAAGAADQPADADADDEVDPELLSDEERVERLLRENGGRMKQANIVKETGWSNAKVSQLLSSMDEDDRVDKLRIGRENLISLPDEDVTDVE